MDKLQKIFLVIVISLVAFKAIIGFGIFFYPLSTASNNIEVSSKELINLTNQYRINRGLKPLAQNPRLTQAALNHANDLLTKNYFDHTSPDGRKFSQWINDVNYKYFYVGENLAIDFDDDKRAFQAWVDSPEHLANLEKPQYQEIGIAVVKGEMKGQDTTVMVQMFGSRVMGANEENNYNFSGSSGSVAQNYFYPENGLEKYLEPKNLQKLNIINDFLLIIFIILVLIAYKPLKRKNQPSIKSPMTRRYQAKTFKE
ncbi:MAG: CAP domain-containing protein [Patescibacteria group bacterium]|jgi:hypothetical protein